MCKPLMANEIDKEPPAAWLVGFDASRKRVVNIPLYRKISKTTFNSFLKAQALTESIPAGIVLHIFTGATSD